MMFIERLKNRYIVIVFAALCTLLILCCFSGGISGNDFWWHVKVGEWICENKAVPTTDIFSWYGMEKNIAWTAHEWLADVLFYLIHSSLGAAGIYILSLAAALAMIYLLIWNTREYLKKNILISGVFYVMLSIVCYMFFYGRPHIFSFFLLFFEMKILYEFMEKPDTRKVFLIPLIACAWSNIHGGSSNLSYILCIIFILCISLKFKIGRVEATRFHKVYIKRLSAVTVLTIGAILVNPVGLHVLAYPYQSLSDNMMMTVISEWQAPDAKMIGNLILYFIPIVLMMVGFVTEEKKVRFIDIAVMGAFLFLFFRSARFIMLWYIVATFYAFPYMPECKVKEISGKFEKLTLCIAGIALGIGVVFFTGKVIINLDNPDLISTVVSEEMINAIKEDNPDRLYNDYNTGETLIYNDIEVFFDARADLYSAENIMSDGVSLMYLEQANGKAKTPYVDVEALVEQYQFDAILILKDRPLYTYLVSHPENYECIYEDDTMGYFKIH